jgi:hypothetical protein
MEIFPNPRGVFSGCMIVIFPIPRDAKEPSEDMLINPNNPPLIEMLQGILLTGTSPLLRMEA